MSPRGTTANDRGGWAARQRQDELLHDSTARWCPPRLVAAAQDGRIAELDRTVSWLVRALEEPG